MIKGLTETSIPNEFTIKMRSKSYNWESPHTVLLFKTFAKAIGYFLSSQKKKDMKVGIRGNDAKGNFLIGASVEYLKNEDEELPGNWSIEMTLDEEAFKVEEIHLMTYSSFKTIYANIADREYGMIFVADHYLSDTLEIIPSVLRTYLDLNAVENEEVGVEVKDCFVSTVNVVDGKKVFAIEMDELIKQIIKDDAAEIEQKYSVEA